MADVSHHRISTSFILFQIFQIIKHEAKTVLDLRLDVMTIKMKSFE